MSLSIPSSSKAVTLDIKFDSALVRVIFRSYLLVLFTGVGLVGDICCANRVKFRLLGGSRRIKLTHTTGWLPSWSSYLAVWKLRALPAGWLGVPMMATAILYLASDFAVTALIQDKVLTSRCPFGTGLVVTQTPANISQVPPQNAAPYWAVTQAQITSRTNGGLTGIYAKANQDLNFSAEDRDVLGGWICQANTTVLEYPSDTLPSDIVNDIVGHGLLYGSSPPSCDSSYGPDGYAHLIAWDSSVADLAQTPFDVRASIDRTGEGSDSKVMQSFDCHLNGTELDGILNTILSKSTLDSWCAALQGRVYDGRFTPASNDTGSILEETLNSMVMVAGGNNYLLNTTAANETQGCLVIRTNIHLVVVILTALDTLIAISMIAYCLVLILLVSRSKKMKTTKEEKDFVKSVEKFTPGDIFGWMAQAIREGHTEHADVEVKCLKEWELGPGPENVGLRIFRREDEESPLSRTQTGSGKVEGEQNGDNTDPPDEGLTCTQVQPDEPVLMVGALTTENSQTRR